MPNPKNKPEGENEEELDAVSAAYESISKKLEELRKKRDLEEDGQEDKLESESEADTDDEDNKENVENDNVKEEDLDQKEAELEPLPGTDEDKDEAVATPVTAKIPSDDPLDQEDIVEESPQLDPEDTDEFESKEAIEEHKDDTSTFKNISRDQDEMKKWEAMQQSKKTFEKPSQLAGETKMPEETKQIKEEEGEPESSTEPTITTPVSTSASDSTQPDSLDDLATESTQPEVEKGPLSGTATREVPTPPPDLDDLNIRQLRPHANEPFGDQGQEHQTRSTIREPHRSQGEYDNYFDRKGAGRRKTGIWQLLILALIGIGVVAGTVYFLKFQFKEQPAASPSPVAETPTPIPTPTPTPLPQVDRSTIKVRVLNGTSKAGLAASVAAKLKSAGYQTDKTGNATNSAFAQTVVRVKEGTQSASLIDMLIKDLAPDFDPTGTIDLKANDNVSAEVILGGK